MADIIAYKPTEGLTSEERTQSGYYAAIKAWVQSLSDVFEKWFDVTYTDDEYKILFTPKAENLSDFWWYISVSTSGVTQYRRYGTTTTSESFSHNSYKSDVIFYLYHDANTIMYGFKDQRWYYIITTATSFDTGEKIQVYLGVYSGQIYYHISGVDKISITSSTYNQTAVGTTLVYRIQQMPVPSTSLMLDNVYYFDGGTASTITEGVFKVSADRYYRLAYNIALKLT